MSTPVPPPAPAKPPVPAVSGESTAQDLDPEEDIAPNLGGEDQMQDA
jgi:hypothetical protein